VAVAGDDTSARADADNDGRISAQEHAAAAQAKFQRMDGTHDGKLTADERSQRRAGAEDAGPHRGGKAKMDADNDGTVARAEHAAGGAAMFDRKDADHDGKLVAAEMEAAPRAGHAGMARHEGGGMKPGMDGDKDGTVTAAEYTALARARFARMDGDHDGYLSRAEMAAGRKK
jgi:Ca2+-binding EF-hand superfamily protein